MIAQFPGIGMSGLGTLQACYLHCIILYITCTVLLDARNEWVASFKG